MPSRPRSAPDCATAMSCSASATSSPPRSTKNDSTREPTRKSRSAFCATAGRGPVRFSLTPQIQDPKQLVVTAVLPGNIGYARLVEFGYGSAQQLEWGLQELERQGIEGLILDLRGNPGGIVNDAVAIVDKFVPAGSTITTMWTNSWEEDEEYDEDSFSSSDSDSDREYPLAILVNRNSASASEMTSGALQDLERGIVVGQTTWGKGIGQSGGRCRGVPAQVAVRRDPSGVDARHHHSRVLPAVRPQHPGHGGRTGRSRSPSLAAR